MSIEKVVISMIVVMAVIFLISRYQHSRLLKKYPPKVGDLLRYVAYQDDPTYGTLKITRIEHGQAFYINLMYPSAKRESMVPVKEIYNRFVKKEWVTHPAINSLDYDAA